MARAKLDAAAVVDSLVVAAAVVVVVAAAAAVVVDKLFAVEAPLVLSKFGYVLWHLVGWCYSVSHPMYF